MKRFLEASLATIALLSVGCSFPMVEIRGTLERTDQPKPAGVEADDATTYGDGAIAPIASARAHFAGHLRPVARVRVHANSVSGAESGVEVVTRTDDRGQFTIEIPAIDGKTSVEVFLSTFADDKEHLRGAGQLVFENYDPSSGPVGAKVLLVARAE